MNLSKEALDAAMKESFVSKQAEEATNTNPRNSVITHIICGDPQWEPTQQELDDIMDQYINAKNLFCTRNGIEVVPLYIHAGALLHVRVKNGDKKEIAAFRDLFATALDDPKGAVVVTHRGVEVSVQ